MDRPYSLVLHLLAMLPHLLLIMMISDDDVLPPERARQHDMADVACLVSIRDRVKREGGQSGEQEWQWHST